MKGKQYICEKSKPSCPDWCGMKEPHEWGVQDFSTRCEAKAIESTKGVNTRSQREEYCSDCYQNEFCRVHPHHDSMKCNKYCKLIDYNCKSVEVKS